MRIHVLPSTSLVLLAGLALAVPAAGAAPAPDRAGPPAAAASQPSRAAAAAPVALPAKVEAGRDGVVAVRLRNRRRQALTVTVVLRAEGVTARKRLRIGAGRSVVARLRLRGAARRKLAAGERVRLRLSASTRGNDGRPRTVSRVVAVAVPREPGGGAGGDDGGQPQDPAPPPFDGTYEEPNGWTMVVQDGVVIGFTGTISTYCTSSARQKNVFFSMAADDPDPTVAPDGSFAWEATAGYGFVKLKYQGRIADGRATGNAVVEDRSPKLGSDRFEFDYCFAGRDFVLERSPQG